MLRLSKKRRLFGQPAAESSIQMFASPLSEESVIPDECFIRILLLLRPSPLCRFKLVSTQVRDLISSRKFIKTYQRFTEPQLFLQFVSDTIPVPPRFLRFSTCDYNDNDVEMITVDLEVTSGLNAVFPGGDITIPGVNEVNAMTLVTVPVVRPRRPIKMLLHSIRGICCFLTANSSIYIGNPALGFIVKLPYLLPPPPPPSPVVVEHNEHYAVVGFGYVKIKKEFMVVAMSRKDQQNFLPGESQIQCSVFRCPTPKSANHPSWTWSTVTVPCPYFVAQSVEPCFVQANEHIFWLIQSIESIALVEQPKIEEKALLLAFDLKDLAFRVVKRPTESCWKNKKEMPLSLVEATDLGKLSLVTKVPGAKNKESIEIWVLDDLASSKWFRRQIIEVPYFGHENTILTVRAIWQNLILLATKEGAAIYWDRFKKEKFLVHKNKKYLGVFTPYVPSFTALRIPAISRD